MYDHFAEIAPGYRDLRTTDDDPVLCIRDALSSLARVTAADIGCGAGRYDLLLFRHLRNLDLTCVDVNDNMLAEVSRHLREQGFTKFRTIASRIEDLRLGEQTLDCVVTFNAVHHFDFPTFLARVGPAVRRHGRIFVYTRTPQQNAGSIWGRYFPEFNERETRLYTQEQMATWIHENDKVELLKTKTFRYARRAPVDGLLAQAKGKHYSTFSLYAPDDFEAACTTFENTVRAAFSDPENIEWHDENIMLEIGLADV